ncbi:protein S100-A6-like [Dromiciops gliroides]|uniref:protein S100-A6-like n=1 Tax=Dromiciops gliroides TaxID=33562 RepID=UPI001CC74C3A|nr:protein S100-A6-like [Dromiciops gliroides]
MTTQLTEAISSLLTVFLKYSSREGNKLSLCKKEVKELIENELTLGSPTDADDIAALMEELDQDKDQEVNFQEFVSFLGSLVMAYSDLLKGE